MNSGRFVTMYDQQIPEQTSQAPTVTMTSKVETRTASYRSTWLRQSQFFGLHPSAPGDWSQTAWLPGDNATMGTKADSGNATRMQQEWEEVRADMVDNSSPNLSSSPVRNASPPFFCCSSTLLLISWQSVWNVVAVITAFLSFVLPYANSTSRVECCSDLILPSHERSSLHGLTVWIDIFSTVSTVAARTDMDPLMPRASGLDEQMFIFLGASSKRSPSLTVSPDLQS